MITFSKQKHFENQELKNEAERYLKFGPHWSRYWMYPFVKQNVDFKDKDILDVGGGACLFADYLDEPWKSFDILDKNPDSCRTKKHTNFIHKDITKEHTEKKYDVILCLSVLEHIKEWKEAIKNMSKSLKINGELVLVLDVFSLKRQFSISQIPEVLTMLSNYDLGKIDLSIDELWSLQHVYMNMHDKFFSYEKNKRDILPTEDLIELFISGQKIEETKNKKVTFSLEKDIIAR